ncbi:Metallo-dependent phosphatase-like protein [Lipomyces starkeyi]
MTVSWNRYSKLSNRQSTLVSRLIVWIEWTSSHIAVTCPTSLTYNNHVKITGLTPRTLYYDLPQCSNSTEPYTMRTARPARDHTPFRVAFVADMGLIGPQGLTTTTGPKGGVAPLRSNDTNTIQSLQMFKSGIAYADYWLKEEIQGFLPNATVSDGINTYEWFLNQYFDEMTAVTTYRPYMVGPGNHDSNSKLSSSICAGDNGGTTDPTNNVTYNASICTPGQTNFTGFRNHYRMPSDESGGTGNFWYYFDHGMAHFIQLDTETDIGHGFIGPDELGRPEGMESGSFGRYINAQINWLAAVHRPYSTIWWMCKDVFEPLLIKYSVDLVLTGHTHYYERNTPVANGVIDPAGLNNPKALWYITNGAAGHYYGWSRLTFNNCSPLTHEFVASQNNTILDTATLWKDRKCN